MSDALTIALLRHAEYHQPVGVPSALLPYPLTGKGVEQAREAAGQLHTYARASALTLLPTIHSSAQLRAWQTARILADELGNRSETLFAVEEYEALAERSVGAAANLRVDEIERILEVDPRYALPPPGWKSDSDYRLPLSGAESLMDAGRRVAGHLLAIWDRHQKDGTSGLMVIVGHGASIRHAAVCLGVLGKGDVGGLSMYHARPVFLQRVDGECRMVSGEWKVRAGSDEFKEDA